MGNVSYRIVLMSILAGTFLVPVNSTMIAVGLPTIGSSLQVSLTQVSWVITIYLIIMATLQPIAGKIGDLYGKKKMFLLGMLLFLIASMLCAFSPSLLWLILFRTLQAIGAAIAYPNGSGLIREVVPKEKLGQTLGVFGMLMGLGAATGPLIGSILIGLWGWKSIFWINIPILIFSLVSGYLYLPGIRKKTEAALDILGSAYLMIGFTVLILIMTIPDFFNFWTVALLIITIVLFILQEIRMKEPLIQFDLFKDHKFACANLGVMLSNAIMYGTIFVMPLFLLREYDYTVQSVGILLFIFSLFMSIGSWVGGSLMQRVGKRRMALLSFIVSGSALFGYLGIYSYPLLPYIAVVLLVGGLGIGLGTASMQAASLEAVPREMLGVTSGIYSTFRYVGGMIASVLISLITDYHWLFYSLLIIVVFGILVSGGLSDRSRKGLGASQN